MAIQSIDELFSRVLTARKKADIEIILKELGDKNTVGLDEAFGPLGFKWAAYGGSESNESTIGLAAKAGRSLTERITNGIDAVLELALTQSDGVIPKSPGEAAERWFGRKRSGPNAGLYNSDENKGDLSRSISVVLSDSGLSGAPTIDVFDSGIGLSPAEMPTTILSLQKGNKVKKPYLMGVFGQGAASTLAFCEYAVVVSRHPDAPHTLAFTILRLVRPGAEYDLDVYAYLTVGGIIPSVEMKAGALDLYPGSGLKNPPVLQRGTLVRHVGFKLSGLDKGLSSIPGNLYHFLHLSMFDPLLPFRVMDIRGKTSRDERVGGSRNRLMRLVVRGEEEDDDQGKTSILHHHEMEDIIPLGSETSRIGVEYWVVQAMRKSKGEMILRTSSSELFVDPRAPIVATLNGQNQGEIEARFIRDAGLGMVARHLVVHLDTSRTERTVRRELFTSTREGFKEGPQLDNLRTTLARILKEDVRLAEIEQLLADRIISRESRSTSDKVKRQITSLLRDAGFSRTAAGDSDDPGGMQDDGAGGTDGGGGGGGGGAGGGHTEPLLTRPFPDVSRWEIVSPSETARVRLNGLAAVRVETDGADQFDTDGLIELEFEPHKVEVASVSPLRGGRKLWRLRAAEGAKIGDSGTVTALLRTPNGGELRTAVKFEVTAPINGGNKGKRGLVPDFDVLPISPDNEAHEATWLQLWPQHETASRTTKAEVAYKVLKAGDKTIVYYSTGYGPYVERVERISSRSKAMTTLFDENYQVWIGYHAILQLQADQDAKEAEQAVLEEERCRVAQVQLRVATEMAELQRKAGQAEEA